MKFCEGVIALAVDMCEYGLQILGMEDLGYAKKPTKLMTNIPELAHTLNKRCSQEHNHTPLLSGTAGPAAAYTDNFVDAVLHGLKAHLQSAGCIPSTTKHSGAFKHKSHDWFSTAVNLGHHLGQTLETYVHLEVAVEDDMAFWATSVASGTDAMPQMLHFGGEIDTFSKSSPSPSPPPGGPGQPPKPRYQSRRRIPGTGRRRDRRAEGETRRRGSIDVSEESDDSEVIRDIASSNYLVEFDPVFDEQIAQVAEEWTSPSTSRTFAARAVAAAKEFATATALIFANRATGSASSRAAMDRLQDLHPDEVQRRARQELSGSQQPLRPELAKAVEQVEDFSKHEASGPFALPPNLRREVFRIHRQLGHPDNQVFARALKNAGASDAVVQWVRKFFRCPTCDSRQKPNSARPGHLTRGLDFNKVIGGASGFRSL